MSTSLSVSTTTIYTAPPEPTCSLLLSNHETLLPNPIIPNTPRGEEYIAPISSTAIITQAVSNALAVQRSLAIKSKKLYDILERLRYEETYIDYYIRSHQAVLSQSALRRMPSELLVEIFKLVLFAKGVDQDVTPKITEQRLFELTWVCQRWRYVILNAPMLWSTFSAATVEWAKHSVSSFEAPAVLMAYLERSQKIPLNVSMDLHSSALQRPVVYLGLAELLSGARIKSLRLINWESLVRMVDEEVQTTCSKLETLILDCNINCISKFPEFTHLKSLTLKQAFSLTMMHEDLGRIIPWWSLSSLTIHGHLSTILQILPFTPSLTELDANINDRSDGPVPSELVHLRRLRHLTVTTFDGGSLDYNRGYFSAHDGLKQLRLIRGLMSHIHTSELTSISFPNASVSQIYNSSSDMLSIDLFTVRSIRTSIPHWPDDNDPVEAQSNFLSDRTPSLRNLELTGSPGVTLAHGVRTLYSISTSRLSHCLTSFSIRYLDFSSFEDVLPFIEFLQLESITADFVAKNCGKFSSTGVGGCEWVWIDEKVEKEWHNACDKVRKLQRTKAQGMDIRMTLRGTPDDRTNALVY